MGEVMSERGDTERLGAKSPARFERTAQLALIFAVLPVVSIAYLWAARHLPLPPREFVISARAFPTVVGVALAGASLWVAAERMATELRAPSGRESASDPAAEAPDQSSDPLAWRDIAAVVALFFLYVVLVEPLGYLVTTPLLIAVLATVFDRKHLVRNVVVAVSFALGVQLLFERIFEIPLP